MKKLVLAASGLIALTVPALADHHDDRNGPVLRFRLEEARHNYRDSVAHYGVNSPETRTARTQLRATRKAFYEERRTRARNASRSSRHELK